MGFLLGLVVGGVGGTLFGVMSATKLQCDGALQPLIDQQRDPKTGATGCAALFPGILAKSQAMRANATNGAGA